MSKQDWFRVVTLPGRSDFSSLNQWLSENNVTHRFTLEGDGQILWVANQELVEPAKIAASNWMKEGHGVDGTIGVARHLKPSIEFNQPFAPVTWALLIFSVVGFALVRLDTEYAYLFFYYDRVPAFTDISDQWYNLREGQYWRAIAPIFLHFGAVHIIFNALWLWFLGTRIESVFGSVALIILVLVTGLASNTAQAIVSFPIGFGGMSGVVYALFGYVWLVGKFTKHPAFELPPALFPIMVVFMLVSWLGAFDWLAGGEVADTAHTVGFFSGLICAGLKAFALSINKPALQNQRQRQNKNQEQSQDEHEHR
jgi:GlpG protein